MGYQTEFLGASKLSRPLAPEHAEYLYKFAETRRMARDPEKASRLPDPARTAVGLPIGEQGGHFVGGAGFAGQGRDVSIVEYNSPPTGQASLWCKWAPTEDGTHVAWNGHEKFYGYVEWLEYLIAHFLKPWGYSLDGCIQWEGEDSGDRGTIDVVDNAVAVRNGHHGSPTSPFLRGRT